MTHLHFFLALAALGIVAVVAVQDYLVLPLRQESISAGLTGPYHWYLDTSYLILAVALTLAFRGTNGAWPAWVSSVALILTAITNTFGNEVDVLTGGRHARLHSLFTGVVFLSAFALELVMSHGAALWALTATNVAAPACIYLLSGNSPYTEKIGVLVLCFWLVSWSLTL
jgi:hypothetical protein